MLLILTILRFQGRTACDPFHTASLHVFQKGHANKQRLQQDVISKISVSLEVSFGNFWCAHNGGNFFCTWGDLQKFWAKNVPNSF